MSMRAVRMRALVAMGAICAVAVAGLPIVAGAGTTPAPGHEPGVRILTLFPALPDPTPIFDTIEDPGLVVREADPLRHFVRVCGADTGVGDMVVLEFSDEAAALAHEDELAAHPGVEGVYRNHVVIPAGAPTAQEADPLDAAPIDEAGGDPDFPRQWPLRNVGQDAGDPPRAGVAGNDIRLDEADRRGVTGAGQIVAVLDEGLEVGHPDLVDNVWVNEGEIPGNDVDDDGNGWVDDVNGWSFATNSPNIRTLNHGTNVAGIIAATADDGIGVRGVAPGAKVMPVDFISFHLYRGSEIGALGAFAYAIANGATVINNSWGTPIMVGAPGNPIIHLAVQCAAAHDIAIAWAAGNVFFLPEAWPAYVPAQNVIIAGGFRNDGCVDHRFNRTAPIVDVLAPSTDVWTTDAGGDHTWFTGTSAATPHVAGVMALLREAHPELSAPEVVLAIRNGARRAGPTPWSRSLGLLSVDGALAAIGNGLLPGEPVGTDVGGVVACEERMAREMFSWAPWDSLPE